MAKHAKAYPDFLPGNQHAAIMTKEEWIAKFKEMYEWCKDEENKAYSLEDVWVNFKMPKSTYYDKCKNVDTIGEYRELMQTIIKARINKMGLENNVNVTMAIFRLKQLGDIDEATVNQKHSGEMISSHEVTFKKYTGE